MTKIGPLFDTREIHSRRTRDAFAEASRICAQLKQAGHVAYFAGGCVRDALLGRQPKDFDVATDATPDRVREIFGRRKTLAFGASFGVIGVLPEKKPKDAGFSPEPTEVATFRSDGDYSDGRRPDRVHYGDARHDALRRDFTINGLFFDPAREAVIDYVGGQDDLADKRLRTIGSPAQRFDEDKLRMLRAVRFATTLGFHLDEQTRDELIERASTISIVSGERIGAEMERIVTSLFAPRGLELLQQVGLAAHMMPDLRFARHRQLTHWLSHRTTLDFDSSMALIVLAMAAHADAPPPPALIQRLGRDWRLSNEQTRRIKAATAEWEVLADADQRPWSQVQPVLVGRDADCVLRVAETIVSAEDRSRDGLQRCNAALQGSAEQLDPPPLITGQTLRQHGYTPGPQFRFWLQRVREAQLDGLLSTPEAALTLVRELDSQRA